MVATGDDENSIYCREKKLFFGGKLDEIFIEILMPRGGLLVVNLFKK